MHSILYILYCDHIMQNIIYGHLPTRVYIKRKSQSCFLEIYGLFSKLPIMYKGKLWKGLTYIV
jgi:hypothetical protein